METITDRIVERANQLKLKQLDIIQSTKAKRATVNKWFNHASEPSVKYLEDLAEVLNVSIQWLVTGYEIDTKVHLKNKVRTAPILSLSEVANYYHHIISVNHPQRDFEIFSNEKFKFNDEVFWVRLEGDNSMLPVFTDNDLILIDPKRQPRTGNIVIAVIDNDIKATLRKFRLCYDNKADKEYYELVALNSFYPDIDSRRSKFQIKGVALKHESLLL